MGLDLALAATATYAKPEQLETFRRHIDAAWIEEALSTTGTATVRRRRLPVEEVAWVVLGMALFRDRPIEDVVSKLDLALPGGGGTVARSSVSQARARLGSEPMKWLFERSASTWAHASADAHRWRGLALYGIDGSSLRVPDTPENRAHFGGPSGRKGTEIGYTMARVVALMVLRSHPLARVWLGPHGGTHELSPAKELRTSIPDHSLTVLDRGPRSVDARRHRDRRAKPPLAHAGRSRPARGESSSAWARTTRSWRWTSRAKRVARIPRCRAPGRCGRLAINERDSARRRC